MLKVLLPTTLPTAMSRSPLTAAITEVATSGIEVPAATMVRPITTSLTPSALANTTAAAPALRAQHQQRQPDHDQHQLHRQPAVPAAGFGGLHLGAYSSLAALVSLARLHDQEHGVGQQQGEQQRAVDGDAAVQAASST
jgi:hypothetical protein